MRKKFLLSLLTVLALFTITGCGNTKTELNENNNEEKIVDETLFTINNLEFHLDKESTFKSIKYTISNSFQEINHEQYVQYNYYQEDNSNLLFFRIFYYENKDINYAINDLGIEENINPTDGKTDNIEYKYYSEPRNDGGTIHFYFISKDKKLYALNFVSKYDIKDFEKKVLNSVKF